MKPKALLLGLILLSVGAGRAGTDAARRQPADPFAAGASVELPKPGLLIQTPSGEKQMAKDQLAAIVFAGTPPLDAKPRQAGGEDDADTVVFRDGKVKDARIAAITETHVVTLAGVVPRGKAARIAFAPIGGAGRDARVDAADSDVAVTRDGKTIAGRVLHFDAATDARIRKRLHKRLREHGWPPQPPRFPLPRNVLFLRDGRIVAGHVESLLAFVTLDTSPRYPAVESKTSDGPARPVNDEEAEAKGKRHQARDEVSVIVLDGKPEPEDWADASPYEDAVMLDNGQVHTGKVMWPRGKGQPIHVDARRFDARKARAIRLADPSLDVPLAGAAGPKPIRPHKSQRTPVRPQDPLRGRCLAGTGTPSPPATCGRAPFASVSTWRSSIPIRSPPVGRTRLCPSAGMR